MQSIPPLFLGSRIGDAENLSTNMSHISNALWTFSIHFPETSDIYQVHAVYAVYIKLIDYYAIHTIDLRMKPRPCVISNVAWITKTICYYLAYPSAAMVICLEWNLFFDAIYRIVMATYMRCDIRVHSRIEYIEWKSHIIFAVTKRSWWFMKLRVCSRLRPVMHILYHPR